MNLDQTVMVTNNNKKVGVMFCSEGKSKDDLMTNGIHLTQPYKLVYKNGKKPKRKVIDNIDGLNLLMGIQEYNKLFDHYCDEPQYKDFPLSKLRQYFRDEIKCIVEVWGSQKMGLSTPQNPFSKSMKRDIKLDKDHNYKRLVRGFYGVNLTSHISKDSSNVDTSTITIDDSLVTEEEFEKMTLNSKKWKDEDRGWIKEAVMKNGVFTYSYS